MDNSPLCVDSAFGVKAFLIAAFLFAVAYVFSFGPAARLCHDGRISYSTYATVYAPMLWGAGKPVIGTPIIWYFYLWVPESNNYGPPPRWLPTTRAP